MNITFDNNKLARLANNFNRCQKEMGAFRAKLFHRRLGDLLNAETLEDVRYLPGKYHELIGDRKGQWACDLDQPYRMIFVPHEKPVPTNQHGVSEWNQIRGVIILEIADYHGK
ncbi:MAG: killer suppression protein HigA [Ignavibacteria bacterium]|nr:killer suppression protein HigA [Ignavibacteria bacterium]